MGLDVYLYKIDGYNQYKTSTEKYQALSEAQWSKRGEYGELAESEKEAARKEDIAIAQSLGLNEDGDYPGMVKVENNSRLYPEHMFKVGYLRSSYNRGGIDALLHDRLDTSLSKIFGNEDGEYEFQPDWQVVRDRAIAALESWRALDESMGGKSYRVYEAPKNILGATVNSAAKALELFKQEVETHKKCEDDPFSQSGYSNRNGEFYLGEPMQVAAFIPGVSTGVFGGPTVYLIVEATGKGVSWYTQALEIVIENCEWVLEQPDKDLYWLRWSS